MTKTTAQLNKQFAFISKAGAKLDAFIQATALDTLAHFDEHKDVRMVCRLYTSLSKGARHAAMAEYIMAFFAVKANVDPATKGEMPFVNDAEKTNDIEGATAANWFDFKPSPTVDQLFDLQAAVKALLKKAGKSACMVGGNADSLAKIAEACGIAPSDVPTGVKIAGNKADAEALIAKAKATV